MTEYVAKCEIYSGDQIRATRERGTERTELGVWHDGEQSGDGIYLSALSTRTFARELLALADEIDGGEAEKKPDTRPKVGDRLRVLEDRPRSCPVMTGDIITVSAIDYDHGGVDCVRFRNRDDSYQWFIPLTAVEAVGERTPEVGDTVRVLKDDSTNRTGQYVGKVGRLKSVSARSRVPFRVEFGDGSGRHGDRDNGTWHVAEVERVAGDPAPLADWERDLLDSASAPRVPVVSLRGDLVTQAKALLSGTPHTAADLLRLAEFLAAE